MNRVFSFLAAAFLALASFTSFAQDGARASEAEAEAMVKKAIAHYKKIGKEKAIADFNKNPGPFVDRDLYVTVYTPNADALAHINPKMVGKNMMELRDGNGKYHIKERMEAAQKAEHGWQDFTFFNPVSKKIEPKTAYCERLDDTVVCGGIYKK